MVVHEFRRTHAQPPLRLTEPPLRLTRRGRVVVLLLLALLATSASAVLFATASRAEGQPAGPAPTIVVRPGDTLWSIASRTSSQPDTQAAVDELRSLNDLRTTVVQPGDVLVLPANGEKPSVRAAGCDTAVHPTC